MRTRLGGDGGGSYDGGASFGCLRSLVTDIVRSYQDLVSNGQKFLLVNISYHKLQYSHKQIDSFPCRKIFSNCHEQLLLMDHWSCWFQQKLLFVVVAVVVVIEQQQ